MNISSWIVLSAVWVLIALFIILFMVVVGNEMVRLQDKRTDQIIREDRVRRKDTDA